MKIKIKHYYPFAILMFAVTTTIVFMKEHVTINVSPSIKEGIYISADHKTIRSGDIVLFCLRDPYKELGIVRHYLIKGTKCSGSVPLIKRVIAVPGDNVILSNSFIEINGQKFLYKTLQKDSLGRILIHYPRGNFRTNGYWLIGSNDPKSWDSRYWGPVVSDQIISVLRPILTW